MLFESEAEIEWFTKLSWNLGIFLSSVHEDKQVLVEIQSRIGLLLLEMCVRVWHLSRRDC